MNKQEQVKNNESEYHWQFDVKCTNLKCPAYPYEEEQIQDNWVWKYCHYCGKKLQIQNLELVK